jgi:hypothetical protein
MSSGNLVQVVYAPETVYGMTDAFNSITMETVRFTSESLSGTPTTTESETIRTDRMSSGLVATGLEVGGSIDWELASDKFFDDWFEAAMMSPWVAANTLAGETVTLTPNPSNDQEADLVITGDFSTLPLVAGDILQLVPASGSPVTVQVISVTSTTEAVVATKRGEAAIVGATMDVEIPQHLVIGAEQQSFVVGKAYLDVPHAGVGGQEHSQTYNGMLVGGFTVNATYGEIVTGNFEAMGNGYTQEAGSPLAIKVAVGGGTVNPAGTSLPLNASIDFPLVTTSNGGVLASTEFCIESLSLTLDNGLDPSNCIGKVAPLAYTLGTASISITMSAYLSDTAYDSLMSGKLTLDELEISFSALNTFGGYAFRVPGAQLSFPDPSSEGQDTQTMIEAEGTGKVPAAGGSALMVYKLVGDS